MQRLLLATGNSGKIQEFKKYLESAGGISAIEFETLRDLDRKISDAYQPVESGDTFQANAYIKAKSLYDLINRPVIAEDSGLVVEALGGRPGVHSARYAPDDTSRIERMLEELKGVKNRKAGFTACICYILNDNDTVYFYGRIDGTIAEKPRGKDGFGYDPVFMPDGYDKTFAEMKFDEKTNLSHRGCALLKLLNYIQRNEKFLK